MEKRQRDKRLLLHPTEALGYTGFLKPGLAPDQPLLVLKKPGGRSWIVYLGILQESREGCPQLTVHTACPSLSAHNYSLPCLPSGWDYKSLYLGDPALCNVETSEPECYSALLPTGFLQKLD